MNAALIWLSADDAPVTLLRILRILLVNSIGAILIALFAWFTVLRALTRRRADWVRKREADPKFTQSQ